MRKVVVTGANLHAELTRHGELPAKKVMHAMGYSSTAYGYTTLSSLRERGILKFRECGKHFNGTIMYAYSLPDGVSASDLAAEVERVHAETLKCRADHLREVYWAKKKETEIQVDTAPKRFFPKKKVMPVVNIMPDSIDALIEAKYRNIERLKAIDKTFLRGRKHMEDIETALQSVLPEDVVNELHNTYILPTLTAIEAALRETSYASPSVQVP